MLDSIMSPWSETPWNGPVTVQIRSICISMCCDWAKFNQILPGHDTKPFRNEENMSRPVKNQRKKPRSRQKAISNTHFARRLSTNWLLTYANFEQLLQTDCVMSGFFRIFAGYCARARGKIHGIRCARTIEEK